MRVHWLFYQIWVTVVEIFYYVYTVSNMIFKYLEICVSVCVGASVFQKVWLHQTDTNKCIYLVDCSQNKQTNKQTYTCPTGDMSQMQSIGRKKQKKYHNPPLYQCWEHSPHISVSSVENDSGDAWSVNFKGPCLQASKELGHYVSQDWLIAHFDWRPTGAPISNSAVFQSCLLCDWGCL